MEKEEQERSWKEFSDGKLTTGIKDYRKQFVLNTFYEHGASEDILYLNKPHLGTNVLINAVKNIRKILKNVEMFVLKQN